MPGKVPHAASITSWIASKLNEIEFGELILTFKVQDRKITYIDRVAREGIRVVKEP